MACTRTQIALALALGLSGCSLTSDDLERAEDALALRQTALESQMESLPAGAGAAELEPQLAAVAAELAAVRAEQAEYESNQRARWTAVASKSVDTAQGIAGTFFPALAPVFAAAAGLARMFFRREE